MSGFQIKGFDHVAIAVRDLGASREWYRRVLGLERRFEDEWGDVPSVMGLTTGAGDSCVALFPVEGEGQPAPGRDSLVMRHFAWRVDRANFDRARDHFRDLGIEFESADHGVAQSVYISDPDGHRIEITTYEV
jgi:catechol 2,3-dioxygenase-like lactoylglutathione lyase family enzyme